ncbi:MAG: serine/threonine-protein kinase [Kofleriaceae bacterium]
MLDGDPTVPFAQASLEGAADAPSYGRFVSLGVLGRGGMGVVLRARDPELGREVAIKVLTWGAQDSDSPDVGERLFREAQAMARLRHPNVVQVYDVGRAGTSRFLVMELVEGGTLKRWLDAERPWRDVLATFIACGRGLLAAHGAGLVHRDFKPENVLIGTDGRPLVADFGLVADGVTVDEGDAPSEPVNRGLSVRGQVVGTPAYMAPEQWMGGAVDVRTDVFAFSASLWEALYRQRPFVGQRVDELRAAVLAGKVAPLPRDHGIPGRIETILRRGLAIAPESRWPTLAGMLDALERAGRRRSGRAVAIGGGALSLAVVALAVTTRGDDAQDPCPDPVSQLAGVWDPATADRVRAAFTAANPTAAPEVLPRVTEALERYSEDWRTATVAACRATKVEGTQSDALLDQRMACLERRRSDLGAIVAAFAAADSERVTSAVSNVGSLGGFDECADRDRLAAFPLPTDAERRRQIQAVDAELNEVSAMQWTRRSDERQRRAADAVSAARRLDHPPLVVRALYQLAAAATTNGDVPTRIATLRELAQRAAEARDDRLAAVCWIDLIMALSYRKQLDEASTLAPVARAAVTRAGDSPALRFRLAFAEGTLALMAGKFEAAEASLRDALAVASDDAARAQTLSQLAQVLTLRLDPAAALTVALDAVAAAERAYGPGHPNTARALYAAGKAAFDLGRDEQAEALARRALAVRDAALVPGHRDIGITLDLLSELAIRRGDLKQARAYLEREIPIFANGRDPNDAAIPRLYLATVIAAGGGFDEAAPLFKEGLAALAAAAGVDSVKYARLETWYAQALAANGRCAQAARRLAHARAVLSQAGDPGLAKVLDVSAQCRRSTR